MAFFSADNGYYIYGRRKQAQSNVIRGEKNTLMFYALGQRQCSIPVYKDAVQFHKVRRKNKCVTASTSAAASKYPQQAVQSSLSYKEYTIEQLDEEYCSNKHFRDCGQRKKQSLGLWRGKRKLQSWLVRGEHCVKVLTAAKG